MTPEDKYEVARASLEMIEDLCEGWVKANKQVGVDYPQTEAILEFTRNVLVELR